MSTLPPLSSNDDAWVVLLERYLAGEASAGEAQAVRAWLAADPANARLLEDLRLIRRVAADRPPETDVNSAWTRAVEELGLSGDRAASDPTGSRVRRIPRRASVDELESRRRSRRRPFRAGALAAAAAVIALLAGRFVWQAVDPSADSSVEQTWREYATQPAQRANVRLRDGTQIVLAPDSRLRVADDFGVTDRDVHLHGEAFFEVVHDDARPFRVHTRGSVAEDLGTAFIVKAYPDETTTSVVVTEGRVALWRADTTVRAGERAAYPRDEQPAFVLDAGDLGRLDADGRASIRQDVDVARYIAWTTGVLVFDRAPFAEVVVTLQRWYDIEIQLADTDIGARPLTATFRSEPVAQVLERVALTLGLRVEQRSRTFVLSRAEP